MSQHQPLAAGTGASGSGQRRHGKPPRRGSGGVLLLVFILGAALIGYAISWVWRQGSSPHAQQVLEVQRGGYQSAELRFCLGVEQVASGVARAEAALAAHDQHDLTLAVNSIQVGYVTAKVAAEEVPHASVDGLTSPRNAVKAARERSPGALPASSLIDPALHNLALAASKASVQAACGHVLDIGRLP